MIRVLSYNILVGATWRVNEVTSIIKAAQPDIVGLVEATDQQVVKELAQRLEMQYIMTGTSEHRRDWQVAVLSRLPIVKTQVHRHPHLTKPALEVCVEEPDGQQLTVFVTHLTAAFNQGWAGDHIRRREIHELLRLMAPRQGTRHLIMGDFNALAPGDPFKGSHLLRYMLGLDIKYGQHRGTIDGHPYLNFVVPPHLRIFNPILRTIPRSRFLSALFDAAASLYAPRGSVGLVVKAGYTDCYRWLNPRSSGFTCPASAPAGRIDFIFASPELSSHLSSCTVITEGEGGVCGKDASDHLAVVAEFGEEGRGKTARS